MKTFVPFHKIAKQKVTIVDGLHPHNLCLSHWKGANNLDTIAADTSGEIVLNAVEKSFPGIENNLVSATHFDIDGFVGVFSLFYPDVALQFKQELMAMARIGDFRELRQHNKIDDLALKLCCWINKVEREKFYRPFGSKDEIELCVEKFDYFLPVFSDVLQRIDDFSDDWKEEYEMVLNSLKDFHSKAEYKNIGLVKKNYSKPSHYYALYSDTVGFDIVLSSYPENKHELEYKYTTWIDLASRLNLPRVDLKPLAEKLNTMETSKRIWQVDSISDTGPILRLESKQLSKADRYANPYEREIFSSSIAAEVFENEVVSYLELAFRNILPKKNWTWSEMRALNS
jgi:hypothetical protein